MTPFIKKKDIKNDWYLVNAENLVVGRLAAYISKVLRGKTKSQFNPNQDNGDFIIVTNIEHEEIINIENGLISEGIVLKK